MLRARPPRRTFEDEPGFSEDEMLFSADTGPRGSWRERDYGPGACPSNLLLRAAILSLRAECSKNGLCGVALLLLRAAGVGGTARSPAGNCPALPLSLRPPLARDGHYSDSLLAASLATEGIAAACFRGGRLTAAWIWSSTRSLTCRSNVLGFFMPHWT